MTLILWLDLLKLIPWSNFNIIGKTQRKSRLGLFNFILNLNQQIIIRNRMRIERLPAIVFMTLSMPVCMSM
jgi:hypothetical protein